MSSAATHTNWAGAAGNAALGFVGHWIGRGFVYAFRHPIETGMTLVLTAGIGLGASNALYFQTARHPAPLFMDTASIARPSTPVIETGAVANNQQPIPTPIMRPMNLAITAKPTTVAPAPITVSIPDKVGNRDVAELQARLTELGFFSGTIDGYYGPKTADAIRRFEVKAGLTPIGAVTQDVILAAKNYVPSVVPQAVQPVADISPQAATDALPADDPIARIVAGANETEAQIAPANKEPEQTVANVKPAATDPELVRMVQTGLSRLGFLHAEISGKFDAETARAIREFENYNNFKITGVLTSDLVDVLMAAGAFN